MAEWRALTAAEEMRVFAGFVAQPFAAAVLGFVAFPLIAFPLIDPSGRALHGGISTNDPMRAAISIAAGAGIAAFFITLCGAFPVVAWLLRRGPLSLKVILWGGVILGNVPFALIVPLAALTRSTSGDGFGLAAAVQALVIGATFGVTGAAVFWAISIRGTALERR